MSSNYVRVSEDTGQEPMELPVEQDNTLLLSTVSALFPCVSGLKYAVENYYRGVKFCEGRLYPPDGYWAKTIYYCVFPKENKRKCNDSPFNFQIKTKRFEANSSMAMIKRDHVTGLSKGFIRFDHYDSQVKVLSERHFISERWCDVKIPDSKDSPRSSNSDDSVHPIGSGSFEEIRRSEFFIDKTLLIERIIRRPEAIFLMTLPPRFGKSVNMDMLRKFFEFKITDTTYDINGSAFGGTNIAKKPNTVREHFKKYPVIHLNLAGTPNNYEHAFWFIWQKISATYRYHDYLSHSQKLSNDDKLLYSEFCKICPAYSPSLQALLEYSLVYLSKFLKKHHEMKCIILVDEFDSPVTNAMFTVTSEELLNIIKLRDVILGNVLKNFTEDVNYRFAVLTGVADIICSVASPLRSISRFPFLQQAEFFEYYGVIDSEFETLTTNIDDVTKEQMKRCYNGYNFNGINLYNTWSIMKSLSLHMVEPFWIEETTIISKFRGLLREERFSTIIKNLIAGESIPYNVDLKTVLCAENLTYIADCCAGTKKILNFDLVLIFLFQHGYLVKSDHEKRLEVPNNEVRKALENLCWNFFSEDCNIDMLMMNECAACFPHIENCLENNFEIGTFCNTFQNFCKSYNSNYFFNHQVLHSLLFMIILKTNIPWSIIGVECPTAEHYMGSTRCDVILFINNFLIIIEIKFNEAVDAAIEQIRKRNYLGIVKNKKIFKSLTMNEIKYYVCFGIAVNSDRLVTMKMNVLDEHKKILKSVI